MKNFTSTILLVATLAFCGCSTDTGDPAKDAKARATNQALAEAGKILGQVATSTLMNVAQQEMSNGKVDFGSAASQGLYTNATNIDISGGISRIISAYSANTLPKTAVQAAAAFVNAPSASPVAKVNAIAAVLSTAAGAPPAI